MPQTTVIYALSFFSGLCLAGLTIIAAWDIIRSFMRGANWRPLMFGAGVLTIVFSFLLTDITRIFQYPLWLYLTAAVGYTLVAASVVVNRNDYLIFLTLLLIGILPRDSVWFLLVIIPVFWISHLVYRHFCIVNCTSVHSFTVKQDRLLSNLWAATISLYGFLSATYQLLGLHYSQAVMNTVALVNIGLKIAIICIMAYLVVNFVRLTKREVLVFPIIIGFLLVSAGAVYLTSTVINDFIKQEYIEDVKDNAKLVAYISNQAYPNGDLAEKIETKSPELNDLADKVFIETGLRPTYFLADTRVAAAPSAINGQRNLGTKMIEPEVLSQVYGKNEIFTGYVKKEGQLIVAAYVPVSDNGRVVGMIGAGKVLDEYEGLKTTVANAVLVGGLASMVIILASVFMESRKSLKAGRHYHK